MLTATFAAAGTVVTEISTPTSAPDVAVESESMPATPAQSPTITVNQSGAAIVDENWWSGVTKRAGAIPAPRHATTDSAVTPISAGKPIASAAKDRSARRGRR